MCLKFDHDRAQFTWSVCVVCVCICLSVTAVATLLLLAMMMECITFSSSRVLICNAHKPVSSAPRAEICAQFFFHLYIYEICSCKWAACYDMRAHTPHGAPRLAPKIGHTQLKRVMYGQMFVMDFLLMMIVDLCSMRTHFRCTLHTLFRLLCVNTIVNNCCHNNNNV